MPSSAKVDADTPMTLTDVGPDDGASFKPTPRESDSSKNQDVEQQQSHAKQTRFSDGSNHGVEHEQNEGAKREGAPSPQASPRGGSSPRRSKLSRQATSLGEGGALPRSPTGLTRQATSLVASTALRSPTGLRRQATALFGGGSGGSAKVLPRLRPSAEFQKQAASFVKQLRDRDKDRVWVIDPRASRILSAWDGITTLALIYTALLTPFEVGFLPASTTVDLWFVINRILDIIFIIDMSIQFCVVYQVSTDQDRDEAFVTERRKIVRHYLFGWFPLDLFSILPSIFDIIPLVDNDADAAASAEKLSGFRAIRALRLIKLVRLIRASRLLTRWQARIGLSHASITVLRIIVFMTLACHW